MMVFGAIIQRVLIKQAISFALVLLFSYAGFSKFSDYETFRWQMLDQPLPSFIRYSLVWFIPASEFIIVLLLLFTRTQRWGLVASVLLMAVFTLYVGAVVFHFFNRIPCSCGGVLQGMSWEVHLVFNLFFMVLSFVGVWASPRPLRRRG